MNVNLHDPTGKVVGQVTEVFEMGDELIFGLFNQPCLSRLNLLHPFTHYLYTLSVFVLFYKPMQFLVLD